MRQSPEQQGPFERNANDYHKLEGSQILPCSFIAHASLHSNNTSQLRCLASRVVIEFPSPQKKICTVMHTVNITLDGKKQQYQQFKTILGYVRTNLKKIIIIRSIYLQPCYIVYHEYQTPLRPAVLIIAITALLGAQRNATHFHASLL